MGHGWVFRTSSDGWVTPESDGVSHASEHVQYHFYETYPPPPTSNHDLIVSSAQLPNNNEQLRHEAMHGPNTYLSQLARVRYNLKAPSSSPEIFQNRRSLWNALRGYCQFNSYLVKLSIPKPNHDTSSEILMEVSTLWNHASELLPFLWNLNFPPTIEYNFVATSH